MGRFPDNVLPPEAPLRFRPRNKLEKALFAQFQQLDAEGDGRIPQEALVAALTEHGEAALAEAAGAADVDGDGSLDAREFITSMTGLQV